MQVKIQTVTNANIYTRDAYELAFLLGALSGSRYDYDYEELCDTIYIYDISDETEFDDFMDDVEILMNSHREEVCKLWRLENESKD